MAFDLDALARESVNEPFEFTFGGEGYSMPASMDLLTAVSMDEGDLTGALKRLLGEAQWERMKAVPADVACMNVQMFGALMEAYTAYQGSDPGKSRASSRSSASTVRPSKRTSSGTTKPGSRT